MAKNMKVAARQDAQATLRNYWRSGAFPVDPVAIAHQLGLKVYSAQLGTDVSGMLIKNPGEDAAIYVDIDDSPRRQRFTVAHELGHYIDRGADAPSMSYVDRRNGRFTLRELYANEFAGHLLMPAPEIQRLTAAGYSNVDLAAHFDVSQDALGTRLRILKLA